MSRDFRIAFPCPHFFRETRVALREDGRTLDLRYPVPGPTAVTVRPEGGDLIPSRWGLAAPAELFGGPGPYNIAPDTRVLSIETQAGSSTVSLPLGRVTTETVLRALPSLVTAEALPRGLRIVPRTNNTSEYAGSRVLLRGGAAGALGFRQRGSSGRRIFPGWGLVASDENVLGEPSYGIRFNEPLRAIGARFSVWHGSEPGLCPRCRGSGVENDYRTEDTGGLKEVTDENLLYQLCMKAILTDLGSNPYHRWYGSTVRASIGKKNLNGVQAALSASVSECLLRVQNLQTEQAKYQPISAKERLYAVDYVEASPVENNPFAYLLEVGVRNFSSERVEITIVYAVPGMTR